MLYALWGPGPFPPIIFVVSVMPVTRVVHTIHAMSHICFPPINILLGVMRVMHVIRVMRSATFHPIVFDQNYMSAICVMRVMNVIRVMRTGPFPTINIVLSVMRDMVVRHVIHAMNPTLLIQ